MIKRQDLFILQHEPLVITKGVTIAASRPFASRPSGVIIGTEKSVMEIPLFADLRINSKYELQPICEVVCWNDMVFMAGLPAIVASHERELLKIDLFRKDTDDSGFYVTDWLEDDGHLFCIYEGGIVAFKHHGVMLWHLQKAWDDIFTSFENGDLVLMESDNKIIAIDRSNGSRKPSGIIT